MVLMPASKLSRVRRLAFSNMSTICLASRAWRYSRGLRLTSWPSLRMARTSALERSAMEHMSSPFRRAAAARTSVSLATGTAGDSMRVLLAMGFTSCGVGYGFGYGGRGCVFREDFVERRDGGVHMGALEDVRRQETQRRIAGAVDDDVALEHFGDGVLGQIGGVEFGGDHQSRSAHIDDIGMAFGQRAQLRLEILADLCDVGEQILFFDVVDNGGGDGAGQRAPAEGGAVHARMEGAGYLIGAERGAHGNAAGQRLGQGGDVWLNAEVLIGAPLSGAAQAGLNFIGDHQGSRRVGQRARLCEKFLRKRTYAALALNGFEEDGADFIREFGAQIGYVVELHKLEAGNDRSEGQAVLFLMGGRDGAKSAAVEALLENQEFGSDLPAFLAQDSSVSARQLERGLDGFSARVGKVNAVHAGESGNSLGQIRHLIIEVVVGGIDQRATLPGDGFFNHLAAVAERVDSDAAEQVEIAIAVLVDQMHVLARYK